MTDSIPDEETIKVCTSPIVGHQHVWKTHGGKGASEPISSDLCCYQSHYVDIHPLGICIDHIFVYYCKVLSIEHIATCQLLKLFLTS